MTILRKAPLFVTAFVFLFLTIPVLTPVAKAGLILNGGFEQSTGGTSGQIGYNVTVDDWATGGYNFLFPLGTADTSGVAGYYGNVQLWGPGNGSVNGLPSSSPDGGNFLALDGAFEVDALTQVVNGLNPGQDYLLQFYWAGAQQYTYTGPTTEQLQVSLGSQTQDTAVLDNASLGFTGWTYQSFTFTATDTSELLSFLSMGTPYGEPPFALLDGVSMDAASPEPTSVLLMAGGIAIVLALKSRNRRH